MPAETEDQRRQKVAAVRRARRLYELALLGDEDALNRMVADMTADPQRFEHALYGVLLVGVALLMAGQERGENPSVALRFILASVEGKIT